MLKASRVADYDAHQALVANSEFDERAARALAPSIYRQTGAADHSEPSFFDFSPLELQIGSLAIALSTLVCVVVGALS